jgi:hypothetical protein
MPAGGFSLSRAYDGISQRPLIHCSKIAGFIDVSNRSCPPRHYLSLLCQCFPSLSGRHLAVGFCFTPDRMTGRLAGAVAGDGQNLPLARKSRVKGSALRGKPRKEAFILKQCSASNPAGAVNASLRRSGSGNNGNKSD